MGEENVSRKRDREDSAELDSHHHESKRVHSASSFQSDVWKPSSPGSSGAGDEIDEVENFGINNGIPEDILDNLDDGDTMPENQDLDSVIRSFEEEILQSSPSSSTKPSEIMELRSDSGEYQLDLGYLLEASDDELGLPPTDSSSAEEQHPQQDPIDDSYSRKSSEVTDLGDMFAFENELPRYDSLGFDLGEMAGGEVNNSNGGFGAVVDDGLFEYSEPSDPADLSWLCGCT